MQKVALVVRDVEDVPKLKKQLSEFEYDENNPDFVVSFGGDGTYLVSEREYPGVPKLVVKKGSSVCAKCSRGEISHLLSKILRGDYRIEEEIKITAKGLHAVNDIVIRNKWPTHAIRFRIGIDGDMSSVIIGDGIVASTPLGSTGYFQSITRQDFNKGIGIAFNNTTERLDPLIRKNPTIVFTMVRGDAVLSADNNPDVKSVDPGEDLIIKKSKKIARIIK